MLLNALIEKLRFAIKLNKHQNNFKRNIEPTEYVQSELTEDFANRRENKLYEAIKFTG